MNPRHWKIFSFLCRISMTSLFTPAFLPSPFFEACRRSRVSLRYGPQSMHARPRWRVAFQAPGVLRGVIGRGGRGPSRLDLLQPLWTRNPWNAGKAAKPATASQSLGYDDLHLRPTGLLFVPFFMPRLFLAETGLFLQKIETWDNRDGLCHGITLHIT